MENKAKNSEFLQSANWRRFQESVGRKTHFVENEVFSASIVEHELPMVGKYFYCPRGPVMEHGAWNMEQKSRMQELIDLAKKESAGWIRIEPKDSRSLDFIRESLGVIRQRRTDYKIIRAPHDMQPKEVFVLDISKTAENLLCEMKPKTRYNIGLAQKKGIKVISHQTSGIDSEKNEYVDEFLRLTSKMAARHGITAHPDEYYRKMIETLPSDMLRIYVAEYDGKIIAANLVLFFGDTATYLHGASGNLHRNLMAPFSLQWQAILDAKEMGCTKYDFGGVKTVNGQWSAVNSKNTWEGITTFKLGFSPKTKPVVFPGSHDIIINPRKYWVYRGLQAAKSFAVRIRR
ncbi:MAG: peptidoglycan bridge formation glycyltransferase FemA/FemB family protein [Candidatus Moranbacteria bacterium]|nr:peptidoglycan bridge formation glycyltransferase FemA/FemB family protein [Candidatus Moranbacteria bacterium]